MRNQRREKEVSPALFWKLEKIALILGNNALIAVIYGLNFSFKVQFLKGSRRKKNFLARPSFFLLYMIIYRSVRISRKQLSPKKILVTPLVMIMRMMSNRVAVTMRMWVTRLLKNTKQLRQCHLYCMETIPLLIERKYSMNYKN